MAEMSIIMAVCGDDDHIAESIESVLNQSFPDFELIIATYSLTNSELSVTSSYEDKRISLIDGGNNYIESMNLGLQASKGKYVIHMHAGDLMHIDLLKLNHSRLEESLEITVCGSWVSFFGEKMNRRICDETTGLIYRPLLRMIFDESCFNFSAMIRRAFIAEHELLYQDYAHTEDFKLSADIASLGGVFYMESQPLLYRRMNDTKILRKHRLQKLQSMSKIKRELLNSLCDKNKTYPAFTSLCNSYFELADQDILSQNEMFRTIHALVMKNMDKFNL